nr:unnamed protein product [Callosobruchus analis]
MKQFPNDDINKKMDHAEYFLLDSQNYSEDQRKQEKHKLSNLKSEIKRRWIASFYREDFLERDEGWIHFNCHKRPLRFHQAVHRSLLKMSVQEAKEEISKIFAEK